jgi:hypothetical protein
VKKRFALLRLLFILAEHGRQTQSGDVMAQAGMNPKIADEVPWSETITEYDESHYVIYLRLLDAHADGATTDEMARVILGIDSTRERSRAEKVVSSHLRRAKWMSEKGYRRLIGD